MASVMFSVLFKELANQYIKQTRSLFSRNLHIKSWWGEEHPFGNQKVT